MKLIYSDTGDHEHADNLVRICPACRAGNDIHNQYCEICDAPIEQPPENAA